MTNCLVLMILLSSSFTIRCACRHFFVFCLTFLLQLLKVFPRVSFRLLFNFQDTDVASTLRRATLLSYHTFCFLSSLFRDIFCRPIFLSDSLFIIPPFRSIVKGFLAFLRHFVNFYIYIKNPLDFLFIQSNRPAKT